MLSWLFTNLRKILGFPRYLAEVLDLTRRHGTAVGPIFKSQDDPEEGLLVL
jgi:hypothetical protein